jgi:acyl-CoA thioesterase FadM
MEKQKIIAIQSNFSSRLDTLSHLQQGYSFFANLLVICHEAYEASLESAGIPIRTFFSQQAEVALPIVKTSASFRQPLFCGDR